MATINWTNPSDEVLVNIAQNAARLDRQIAVISRESSTTRVTKVDNYYFLSSSDGSEIRLRNDKKQLLELQLSWTEGVTYKPPVSRDGSPNVEIVNLIADISKHSYNLNTDLGLDWLVVCLDVYNSVMMRRIDAVSTDIQYATVTDWVDSLRAINEDSAIRIIDWLINSSSIKSQLTTADKTVLKQLSDELSVTHPPVPLLPMVNNQFIPCMNADDHNNRNDLLMQHLDKAAQKKLAKLVNLEVSELYNLFSNEDELLDLCNTHKITTKELVPA